MLTWSNSSDVDPFYEATFQCGFGINEVRDHESINYQTHHIS